MKAAHVGTRIDLFVYQDELYDIKEMSAILITDISNLPLPEKPAFKRIELSYIRADLAPSQPNTPRLYSATQFPDDENGPPRLEIMLGDREYEKMATHGHLAMQYDSGKEITLNVR